MNGQTADALATWNDLANLVSHHMIRVAEPGGSQLRCDCGWHCPRPAGPYYDFDAVMHLFRAAVEAGVVILPAGLGAHETEAVG